MSVPTPLTVVLFTRLPKPGRTKTRLIPALGADGAAALQRQMTRLAVARAWTFCASAPGRRLVVAFDGGSEREMRAWLGPLTYWPQGDGDLGVRMQRAACCEFQRGARAVMIIGADCPRLENPVLESAEQALKNSDLVLGPANDGGYYLVGLRRMIDAIFTDIPWGTGEVLHRSVHCARQAGIEPNLLPVLPDVDELHDLPDAMAALTASRTVSVVIPALNAAENLRNLLLGIVAEEPHEILVADGGSTDDTVAVAESFGVQVVRTDRGRGRQMNAAARVATGEHLLFLHADTEPPEDFPALVAQTLGRAAITAGAFQFRLREPVAGGALIEWGVALRCALRQLPYGDQGLFVRRALFQSLGGFREWPSLEDLDMVRRLRTLGRIAIIPEAAATSSRRWREEGVIRTFLRHQFILLAHALGKHPSTRSIATSSPPSPALLS